MPLWVTETLTKPLIVLDSSNNTIIPPNNSQRFRSVRWQSRAFGLIRLLSIDLPVKRAPHAKSHIKTWMECNHWVGKRFKAKTSRPLIELFSKLGEKIKVLLFSGYQDL
ncbi:hypothetical protein BY996DRAFT_8429645 [Phakopsora pachyrhizi]|nr:hypothetical protein BY996DRAFT_8429645 [Phakopsora pachyrhizi]